MYLNYEKKYLSKTDTFSLEVTDALRLCMHVCSVVSNPLQPHGL